MDADLLIRGGTIVDGSGEPAFEGDVAIRDGRIVAIGRAGLRAHRTVDATGHVVAPGFVDIHTHYDAQVLWDRMLTISPWHGVTTVVMGNCGFGLAPTRAEHRGLILRTLEKVEGMSLSALEAGLGEDWSFETFPEYLSAIEARGTAINVGVLLGHTPLRFYVMGEAATERAATADEVDAMRAILRDALRAGAIGLATSASPTHVGYEGRPVPSRVADRAEIDALAGELGRASRGILQATFGPGLFLDEFAEIARRTGRPISWTALLTGMLGEGGHRDVLERTEAFEREGLSIVPQVTGRPLNFEFDLREPFLFESLSVFKPVSAADFEGKRRIYADPAFRAAFKEKLSSRRRGLRADRWGETHISHCPTEPSLEEAIVADVARERGVDPVDLVLDLSLVSGLTARFRMAVLNTNESEVRECLEHPSTVLGLSDAGAHASQLCDGCFATDLLARWVREKGVLSLEHAVRMLTARPAEVFGITDRGRLAPGLAADVVVFDLDRVAAGELTRVRDLPGGADRLISRASGIEAVIVNGTVVRRHGEDVVTAEGRLPGRVLRG